MHHRVMAKKKARPVRKPSEQADALGHLLYEALILASALVFRNKRHLFSFFDDLQWGIPQIAQDVIRLKARLLLDFFEPQNPHPDDILVQDFTNVPAEPSLSPAEAAILAKLTLTKHIIHQGTVHLS